MDWSNIDLDSPCELGAAIVDEYTVAGLLLEISCNLPEITPDAVMRQFEAALSARVESARDIMRDNLLNIARHANRERNAQ
jgi:hypothetical protein